MIPNSPDDLTLVVTPEDIAGIDSLKSKICSAPNVKGRMYHAITRGWLVNGIVRRVDPKRRTLGVFMKEEICDPFGLTFFCGIPKDEQGKYQFAKMTQSGLLYDALFQLGPAALGYGEEPELGRLVKVMVQNENSMAKKKVMSWSEKTPKPDFNDTPLGRSLEISSGGMFANARSIARINATLAADGSHDGVRILSPKAVHESMDGLKVKTDSSLSLPEAGIEFTYGMTQGGFGKFNTFFEGVDVENTIVSSAEVNAYGNMFGWGGWGGSLSLWDREKNVALSYVPNAMGLNLLGGRRQRRILLEMQNHI